MKKILVIINKNWETEPVLNALTNPKLRPAALPFPEVINTPCDGDNRMSQPRAVFSLPREGEEPLQVVVRCIEDLMATNFLRPIQTRSRFASGTEYLKLARYYNSPDRSTKSTSSHFNVL